jgi:hypothetical protein
MMPELRARRGSLGAMNAFSAFYGCGSVVLAWAGVAAMRLDDEG